MPRIARVVAANCPHHITQRGNNRADVFWDDEDRKRYLHILQSYCTKHKLSIWAYCLMPNHVHVLAVPDTAASLALCVGRTNLLYTQHVNRKYNRSGRLWQNRFFSTIVDSDRYVWAVARYIEQNPVKALLVKRAEDYVWSSCRATISGRSDGIVMSNQWLDGYGRRAYRKFLKQSDNETEGLIRRATSTGRPLGDNAFIKKLERAVSRKLLPGKPGRPKARQSI